MLLLLALLIASGPALKAPSPLEAHALGPYSASVSWKAPVDALGVELGARRAKGGRWTLLALQRAQPAEFMAHALPPGTSLELRARSWNGRGPSDWTSPVAVRTQDYVEPPLDAQAVQSPCVARDKLLETALGHPPGNEPECDARKLQSAELIAGKLRLTLVDPVSDAPSCHGDGGNLIEAFAEVGGCLRSVGKLIERTRPLSLPKVSVPPLRSYWHLTAGTGMASIVELREGHLQVVDRGPIDSASAERDLPGTTDEELLDQLQGASGAPRPDH